MKMYEALILAAIWRTVGLVIALAVVSLAVYVVVLVLQITGVI